MKTIIAIILATFATFAAADEPQVCVAQSQADVLIKGVFEMSSTINRQRVEIDRLRRILTEHGIDPTPELWLILQRLEAERK